VEKVLIFLGMGLVTYMTRFAMIAALGRELPPLVRRWLRHVPVAVLSALIAPAALAPRGRLELGPHVWATAVATVVAWRTRGVMWTILAGMGTFWLLRAIA
jgi:branched-subunit amino acid transport protein